VAVELQAVSEAETDDFPEQFEGLKAKAPKGSGTGKNNRSYLLSLSG